MRMTGGKRKSPLREQRTFPTKPKLSYTKYHEQSISELPVTFNEKNENRRKKIMEENKTELKLIQMSEIETEEISWLWFPFIPYGKLTIIQGDPGDGKGVSSFKLINSRVLFQPMNDVVPFVRCPDIDPFNINFIVLFLRSLQSCFIVIVIRLTGYLQTSCCSC